MADVPINVETVDDLLTPLEVLKSPEKSHKLETEPTVTAVSGLRADVNRLMETFSTRVSDAKEQANIKQSTDNRIQQSTEQQARNSTAAQRFVPINPIGRPTEDPQTRQRDFSALLTSRKNNPDHFRQALSPSHVAIAMSATSTQVTRRTLIVTDDVISFTTQNRKLKPVPKTVAEVVQRVMVAFQPLRSPGDRPVRIPRTF